MPEPVAAEAAPSSTPPPTSAHRPKLTILPLIALIFFDVSGGPFGVEDSVGGAGGPLLSLLGFIFFPLLWSLPEALITAELSTLFPSNGGYVLWISSAFGRFWGFQLGVWKFASGAMDNALYPVLFLDYLKRSIPLFSDSSPGRPLALIAITAALTFLNYRGLHIVGFSAIILTLFSLSPFIVLSLLALPRIRPRRWISVDLRIADWRVYFNSMFWNLNYWDKASALAGEVEEPSRAFPRAIFGALGLVVASYLVPLLAGTGATNVAKAGEWSDGYFAQVGLEIGGKWLSWWIQVAAAMSNMGLFEAEMSSDSFQLLGMSEMGMIPEIFSRRSKYGTPTISILCSATGVLLVSWMSFQEILEFLNFLYALGMLLEFAAFIKLRIKKPDLHRPYKVPVDTFWAIVICIPPAVLLLLVMSLASIRTFVVSGTVFILGIILYPIIHFVKDKEWVRFITKPESLDSCDGDILTSPHLIDDEASIGLLLDPVSLKESQDSEANSEAIFKLE